MIERSGWWPPLRTESETFRYFILIFCAAIILRWWKVHILGDLEVHILVKDVLDELTMFIIKCVFKKVFKNIVNCYPWF